MKEGAKKSLLEVRPIFLTSTALQRPCDRLFEKVWMSKKSDWTLLRFCQHRPQLGWAGLGLGWAGLDN